MSDLPITDEMVAVVAKAMWEAPDDLRCYPWNPEMEDCQDAMVIVRLGLEVAWRAGGFEVETSTYLPVGAQSGIDEQRLVGPWVRVSGETQDLQRAQGDASVVRSDSQPAEGAPALNGPSGSPAHRDPERVSGETGGNDE